MEWIVGIICFVCGMIVSFLVTSIIAAKRIDNARTELTKVWSNIAMQITDNSDKSINIGEWLSKGTVKEDKNE